MNNRHHFHTGLLMIIAMLISAAVNAAEVEVYGVGQDRESAILDAQRSAVSTVMGQYVESRSLVANYQLVSDRILTSSQGYIKDYVILSEGTDPAGYVVRIKANVTLESIRDDLNAIAVLQASRGNPRFMVVPDPNPLADAFTPSDPAVGEAMNGIQSYLSERQMNLVQGPSYAGTLVTGNAAMLRDLSFHASGLGAEFAIYYSVMGKKSGHSRTFSKAVAVVNLTVVHTGSYRIVAQADGRAEGADNVDMEFAYRKAAKEAARKASAQALDLVLAYWSRTGTTAGATFNLHLQNIEGAELEEFEKVLERSGLVKSVTRRSFNSGIATLDILIQGDLRDLGEAVHTVTNEKGWAWALVGSEGSSLTYRAPDSIEEGMFLHLK